MKLRKRERWCVKHRTGWCATAENREPAEGTTWVPTLCGIKDGTGIVAPWGYDKREPDCPDCLALLPASLPQETPTEDDLGT